ncbi:MAG TPA: two-component regulator propeller domain-containing protein, partial [Pyrinomonadaceae bacterium]|nr:two-component regulator propeller domain-containing protein [Pyrinomonadaceae bacterium]
PGGTGANHKGETAPVHGQKFTAFVPGNNERAKKITTLFKDGAGNLWCGTTDGLFRIEKSHDRWQINAVEIGLADYPVEGRAVRSIVDGQDHTLWVGTESGLYRLNESTRNVERFTTKHGLPTDRIYSLIRDSQGHIWAGTPAGLCQLGATPKSDQNIVTHLFNVENGLIHNSIVSLLQSSDGRLWVGTRYGLSVLTPAANGERPNLQNYTTADGLSDIKVKTLREDSVGNVWLGTESIGVMKIARDGFVSYRVAEGLGHIRILSIFENLTGDVHVISGSSDGGSNDQRFINHFDGKRFTAIRPNLGATKFMGQSWYQAAFQDHAGEWWIATGEGLFRFPKTRDASQLAQLRPLAHYTTQNGLSDNHIYRLFEDSRKDIWLSAIKPYRDLNKVDSSIPPGANMLTRWERNTNSFHQYTLADGVPQSAPNAFVEDAAGNLWIGFSDGYLMRYRGGRFLDFSDRDGADGGEVYGMYRDRSGRLWIAYYHGGVTRIDSPETDEPRFTRYTTAEGLASNQAGDIVEDQWGSIYIGTGRGVDRLDVPTGRIKHYTMADGLIGPAVHAAHRDRAGALWFATLRGLSRLAPQPERAGLPPPPIRIMAVAVNSLPQPISDLGETELTKLELTANQNQIRIDFLGLGFSSGESLLYQYKLEGADSEWSAPTLQRTVNYANLAPSSYRFLVRSVDTEGQTSAQPASVAFTIWSPIWRRWWFLTLAALLVAAAIFALARNRVARLKALRESESRFRTLAETASDAIITIDERSIIIYVNDATENIFGYSVAEMVGADLTMLMPEYLRHLHHAGLARYVETSHKHISWEAVELPGLHQSGREIPLELSFGEFTKDNRRYFTGIVRDITERKRAEETLRRTREERLIELELVRKRIARDLHDDIGSSLTQISLLSEVVSQRLDRHDSLITQPLATIATSSRELVDSMSDIVWAINPQKDHLSDLMQRMRGLASDMLTNCHMKLRFRAPDTEDNIRLGANLRREVFLVFKESINNIVKHSGGTEVEVDFRVTTNSLLLSISDNGRGFDPAEESEGHGLVSMRERIREMGGTLEMTSQAESGTTITMKVPMTDQV